MLLTEDGAAIYTVNNTGGGTIAYNTIYNVTPQFQCQGRPVRWGGNLPR